MLLGRFVSVGAGATAVHYLVLTLLVEGFAVGAAVAAALKLQEDEAFTNKNIVVILPSSGERYLSTALFADLFTEKELQQ